MLHELVRRGWAGLASQQTLPKHLEAEVRRYLGCGQLARGFVQVECEDCGATRLVAFSCKGRGWCPSCAAKRALESATHLEEVLPRVGYRQWTLTLPRGLRWAVRKRPELVRCIERLLVRAVWRWQRARARKLGVEGALRGGAVGFLQLFGSALHLSPHLHVLVPEGQWSEAGELVVLPPPEDEEVEAVLHRMLRRVRAALAEVEELWPEDEEEALWAEAAQHRLELEVEAAPRKKARRLAVAMGFSLHADTAVHVGLKKLCGYGARGPVAEERLTRLEDGRYRWQPKRGAAVTLTAADFLKRLLALVPPKGLHHTCFHGVFAPNASLRGHVLREEATEESASPRLGDRAAAHLRSRRLALPLLWRASPGPRHHAAVAADILRSLGLLSPAPALRAQAAPQLSLSLA